MFFIYCIKYKSERRVGVFGVGFAWNFFRSAPGKSLILSRIITEMLIFF